MAEGGREMRLPHLRLAMTGKKGCNAPVFVIARHSPSVIARHASAEAIPRLNPKLEALNPEQILISKFKTQKLFGSLGFWSFGIV